MNQAVSFTVHLERNGTIGAHTVQIEICPAGTGCDAVGGTDFQLDTSFSQLAPFVKTLTFPPGTVDQSFDVYVVNDAVDDGDRLLTLRLQAAVPAAALPAVTTLEIADDDDSDLSGTVIPTPSGPAGAQMCEGPGNPRSPGAGPGPCGASAIPLTGCSQGMSGAQAITAAWQYNLEDYPNGGRVGNSIRAALSPHHAMVFKFRTGAAGSFTLPRIAGIAYDEHTSYGPFVAAFMTLSTQRCDFDYTRINVDGCYGAQFTQNNILFEVRAAGQPPAAFPYCTLRPDTHYYLNVRFERPAMAAERGTSSCDLSGSPGSTTCGFVLAMQ